MSLGKLVPTPTGEFDSFLSELLLDEPERYLGGWRIRNGRSYAYLELLDDQSRRSILLQAFLEKQSVHQHEALRSAVVTEVILGGLLTHFARVPAAWTLQEVQAVLAATSAVPFDSLRTIDEYGFAVGLAEQLLERGPLDEHSVEFILGMLAKVKQHNSFGDLTDDAISVHSRLLGLLGEPRADDLFGGALISDEDPFGRAVLEGLKPLMGSIDFGSTVRHVVTPGGTATWRSETNRRHTADNLLRDVARTLIDILSELDLRVWILPPSSVALIKGAAAVLAQVGDASDVARLEQAVLKTAPMAQNYFNAGVPTRACITALGQLHRPEAQGALARLQAEFRTGDLKKRIAAALDDVARRSGLSAGQLIERQVGDYGLDSKHAITVGNAALAADLCITNRGVLTTWRIEGRPVTKIPADVRATQPDVLSAVKSTTKSLKGAFAAQRARIEGLFG
jgi:hypothetical protein